MEYMKKGKYILFLALLVLLFSIMNYNQFNGFLVKNLSNADAIVVDRVIDGDTIVGEEGKHYRLLGINTPEKGEKYYEEAKNYTESLVMNRTIQIESKGMDLYDRELAYLFYNDENLNSKIIEKGYANAYFPEGKDNHYFELMGAWQKCIEKNENLCKKSSDKCTDCIIVKRFSSEENLILYNSCSFSCNLSGWSVKDEGRKKFVFKNLILKGASQVELTSGDFNETYVWTDTGDTMFVRDRKGDLVVWENY